MACLRYATVLVCRLMIVSRVKLWNFDSFFYFLARTFPINTFSKDEAADETGKFVNSSIYTSKRPKKTFTTLCCM